MKKWVKNSKVTSENEIFTGKEYDGEATGGHDNNKGQSNGSEKEQGQGGGQGQGQQEQGQQGQGQGENGNGKNNQAQGQQSSSGQEQKKDQETSNGNRTGEGHKSQGEQDQSQKEQGQGENGQSPQEQPEQDSYDKNPCESSKPENLPADYNQQKAENSEQENGGNQEQGQSQGQGQNQGQQNQSHGQGQGQGQNQQGQEQGEGEGGGQRQGEIWYFLPIAGEAPPNLSHKEQFALWSCLTIARALDAENILSMDMLISDSFGIKEALMDKPGTSSVLWVSSNKNLSEERVLKPLFEIFSENQHFRVLSGIYETSMPDFQQFCKAVLDRKDSGEELPEHFEKLAETLSTFREADIEDLKDLQDFNNENGIFSRLDSWFLDMQVEQKAREPELESYEHEQEER